MKKKLLLLMTSLLVITSLVLTGCGGNDDAQEKENAELTDWEYIQDKGELIIGLDDTFAPMGFRDENDTLVGFDIDLANAVGEELGVKVTFKPIDWDAKDMELSSKKIDCIWNGMSITPERKEAMSLSNKYINNKIVVMTLDKNVKVEKAEDLAKYNVATQADSAALEVLKSNKAYDTYQDKINEYKNYDLAIQDMQTGRMDCVVIDQVLGEYKNSKMDDELYLCDYDFGDDFYVIGFRKEDTQLTTKVNEAIKATIDSGKAEEVSNKWFGKNIVIFEELD